MLRSSKKRLEGGGYCVKIIMLSRVTLWRRIEELLASKGFMLFDLELPQSKFPIVKVFVSPEDKTRRVGIDECSQVNRSIRQDPELSQVLAGYELEVSSPGINRKLSRQEHFATALGERVKMVFKFGPLAGQAVIGELKSFEQDCGTLFCERTQAPIDFKLSDIKSAQVDFLF